MLEGSVLVISGLPGAGKSTTSLELAKRLDRAALVEADALHMMIKSGRELPDGLRLPAEHEEAGRQLDLRFEQACLLARSFAAAGFTAIIDEIVIGDRLAKLADHLVGVETRFVMLSPEFGFLQDRWRAIDSPFVDRWRWIEDEKERTPTEGLWLDTTDRAIDEVVDEILRRLDEAKLAT